MTPQVLESSTSNNNLVILFPCYKKAAKKAATLTTIYKLFGIYCIQEYWVLQSHSLSLRLSPDFGLSQVGSPVQHISNHNGITSACWESHIDLWAFFTLSLWLTFQSPGLPHISIGEKALVVGIHTAWEPKEQVGETSKLTWAGLRDIERGEMAICLQCQACDGGEKHIGYLRIPEVIAGLYVYNVMSVVTMRRQ